MSLVSGGGGGNTAAPPALPAPPSSAGATSGSQESIAHKLHLPWWPQGDTGKLRDAARAYRACATALTDAAEQGQRGISDITTANTGTAVTAIGTKWSGTYYGRSCLATPSAGAPAFDNAIATCTLLAQACDDYAQHIDDAKHRLEELAAELVAGLVVGGLLTFVTAGLSDAAAVANAARVATAALELADTVGTYVTLAFRIGGLVIQGALVGAGSDLAMQAVRITAVPNTSFNFHELATATEFGAAANPAFVFGAGALGRGLAGLRGLRDVADVPGEVPWLGPGPDPAAARVKLRVGVQQAIKDAQPRLPTGEFYDPITGEVIPEFPRKGWQFGHVEGHEWWRTQNQARSEGWSREQVIEHQNDPDLYTIQSRGTNQSHAGEEPYGAGASTDASDLVHAAQMTGNYGTSIADVLQVPQPSAGERASLLGLDDLTRWADTLPTEVHAR